MIQNQGDDRNRIGVHGSAQLSLAQPPVAYAGDLMEFRMLQRVLLAAALGPLGSSFTRGHLCDARELSFARGEAE